MSHLGVEFGTKALREHAGKQRTHSQTHTHKYPHTHNVAFIFDSSSEHVAHFEEYVFFEIISNLLLM